MLATPPPAKGIWAIGASWDDVPHLDAAAKAALLEDYPAYQRDARSKGIPMLGSGVIYPVAPESYEVEPFEVPSHWPRAYGLDVGWNRTAVVWGAWDRTTDTVYLYSEHYMGEEKPPVHIEAIQSRGNWIPGVIDPASRGRSQRDGEKLLEDYQGAGLDLIAADNAVETGVHKVFRRLASGRLKIMKQLLPNWRSEIRLYRRNEKGKIVKERDHLMDCTRYLIMSGMARAITEPVEVSRRRQPERRGSAGY